MKTDSQSVVSMISWWSTNMEGKCFKLNKHLWQKVGRCHYYFTIEKKWCSTVILSQDKCRLILSELAPYIIYSEYIVFFKHSIIGSQCFITYRHQTVSLKKYCLLSYDILCYHIAYYHDIHWSKYGKSRDTIICVIIKHIGLNLLPNRRRLFEVGID